MVFNVVYRTELELSDVARAELFGTHELDGDLDTFDSSYLGLNAVQPGSVLDDEGLAQRIVEANNFLAKSKMDLLYDFSFWTESALNAVVDAVIENTEVEKRNDMEEVKRDMGLVLLQNGSGIRLAEYS